MIISMKTSIYEIIYTNIFFYLNFPALFAEMSPTELVDTGQPLRNNGGNSSKKYIK